MAKYKVLIIEDDKELNEALNVKLEKEGFEVFSAHDGIEGEKMALEQKPDGILLDIVMPGSDGLEVLGRIRQDVWGKGVPVLMLTNMDDIEHIAQALEHESSDYLVKADHTLEEIVKRLKERMHV